MLLFLLPFLVERKANEAKSIFRNNIFIERSKQFLENTGTPVSTFAEGGHTAYYGSSARLAVERLSVSRHSPCTAKPPEVPEAGDFARPSCLCCRCRARRRRCRRTTRAREPLLGCWGRARICAGVFFASFVVGQSTLLHFFSVFVHRKPPHPSFHNGKARRHPRWAQAPYPPPQPALGGRRTSICVILQCFYFALSVAWLGCARFARTASCRGGALCLQYSLLRRAARLMARKELQ